MRYFITSLILFFSSPGFGQEKNRYSLLLQVQPEWTYHQNDYAFRWSEKHTLTTFNTGLNASLQYQLTKRLFVDWGLGFVSRKLDTKIFVAQSRLPPPYLDSTQVLYIAKSVSFRTLEFPFGISYSIISNAGTKIFVRTVFIPNFLLSEKYETNRYPGFTKNYWQGYSLNAGIGFDQALNKKMALTVSLAYSFLNTVKKDPYTFSQDESKIALTHSYLQLSAGVKIKL
jgi:hypothetical protein